MTSTHVFVPLDIRVTLNFAHICEKAKFQAILLTDFNSFWNLDFSGDLMGNGGRRSVVTIRASRRNYRKLTANKLPMGGRGGGKKKRHYAPVPLSALVHFERVRRF